MAHELADRSRGEAEGKLVYEEDFGLAQQRSGQGEHLLLAARQGLGSVIEAGAQLGEQLNGVVYPALPLGLVVPQLVGPHLQVVSHAERRPYAASPQQGLDSHFRSLLGGGEGDGAATHAHHPPFRGAQTGDDPQDGRLSCPVGAQQGQGLALSDLETDIEEHLDVAVAEVDVGQLQGGGVLRVFSLAVVFGLLFEYLRHVARQVAPYVAGAVQHERPADDGGGQPEHQNRGLRAAGVDHHGRQQATAGRADEEDVQRGQRRADAPKPVGNDGLHEGPDHGESGEHHQRTGDVQHGKEPRVGHVELDGQQQRGGQDERADQPHRPGGALAVEAVEPPSDERHDGDHPDPGRGGEGAAAQRAQPVLIFEEQ